MLGTIQFIAGCCGIIVAIGLGWLIYKLKKQNRIIRYISHVNEDLLRDVQNLSNQVDQLKSERSILILRLEEKECNKKGKK